MVTGECECESAGELGRLGAGLAKLLAACNEQRYYLFGKYNKLPSVTRHKIWCRELLSLSCAAFLLRRNGTFVLKIDDKLDRYICNLQGGKKSTDVRA